MADLRRGLPRAAAGQSGLKCRTHGLRSILYSNR